MSAMDRGTTAPAKPVSPVATDKLPPPATRAERLHREIQRWAAPGFVPGRLVDRDTWAQVAPFITSFERSRPVNMPGLSPRVPVLYATAEGSQLHGSIMRSRTLDVLVEIYSDGHARCTGWRRGARKSATNADLEVSGGVGNPATHGRPPGTSLAIHDVRGHLMYFLEAPSGSSEARIIEALNARLFERPATNAGPVKLVKGVRRDSATTIQDGVAVPSPPPRLVRDAAEAESLATEWIGWLGWPDAITTRAVADEGVDVIGRGNGGVVAQVKFEAIKTGRPALQALFGAGQAMKVEHFVFFSSAGYSSQAQQWADGVGMMLFRFTLNGSIEPINSAARSRFETTQSETRRNR